MNGHACIWIYQCFNIWDVMFNACLILSIIYNKKSRLYELGNFHDISHQSSIVDSLRIVIFG